MPKLDDLPWWVKWAFAGGVGLVTTFASAVLGIDYQRVGFWAGAALIIASVGGVVWHYRSWWWVNATETVRRCIMFAIGAVSALAIITGGYLLFSSGGDTLQLAHQASTQQTIPPIVPSQNAVLPETEILHLDDTEKWQFTFALKDELGLGAAWELEQGGTPNERFKDSCRVVNSISENNPQAGQMWRELHPLLHLAGLSLNGSAQRPRRYTHTGVLILVPPDNEKAIKCGGGLNKLFQSMGIVPSDILRYQVTPDLLDCEAKQLICIELLIGNPPST